jgi:hypothetical protein
MHKKTDKNVCVCVCVCVCAVCLSTNTREKKKVARETGQRTVRAITHTERWVVGAYCRVTNEVVLKPLQTLGRGGRNRVVANEFIDRSIKPMSIIITDSHNMYDEVQDLPGVCVCVCVCVCPPPPTHTPPSPPMPQVYMSISLSITADVRTPKGRLRTLKTRKVSK